jgi:hypothetical protein
VEKQTKNIITREGLEKELRFYNKANLRSTVMLCIFLSLILVPVMIAAVYAIPGLFRTIWAKILVSVFLVALMGVPLWINFRSLIVCLRERKSLKLCSLDIITAEVAYKGERLVHRHMEKYLHFKDFGDAVVGGTTFDLATQGDEFYLVCYKGHTSIQLLYPLKMYEFKEE